MAEKRKVTAVEVESTNKRGRYRFGDGLYLQVAEGGSKQWVLRYMLDGKQRHMGLGSVSTFTLKEARERARRFRQQLADGIDPIEERNRKRAEAAAAAAARITFKDAAGRYISSQRAGWKNAKHAGQWEATLEAYAYPVLGDLSVTDIETAHIVKVLEPIWTKKPETASRVRGRIEKVLGWARVNGFRQSDNPAQWRGHLANVLPAKTKVRQVKHHDAMPFTDVPAFMERLRASGSVSAKALEFTILTASRTGEAIGARWPEIDFTAKVWTIPGERMKSGREHRVPLSDRALEILKSLPREEGNPYVFIGGRKGKGLSNMAMLELLKGMSGNGYTVHGFRSAFRDWAGDQTNHPREVAEAALAHVVKDKTEAAYRRATALEKRRKLMAAWAAYCAKPTSKGDNVVPMRRRGAK